MLLKMTDVIINSGEDGKITIFVLSDFSRAFDSAWVGLNKPAISLISEFLPNREQMVTYVIRISRLKILSTQFYPQDSMLFSMPM